MRLKKFLPKTFFGRSLAIIIIPMIILQSVLIYFFYERHWEDVGRRLVLGLGGQISYLITKLESKEMTDDELSSFFALVEQKFFIKSIVYKDTSLNYYSQHKIKSVLDKTLRDSLKERLSMPYIFDTKTIKNKVLIFVQTRSNVIQFEVTRKTLHSSTIEVFLIWMISTSILLIMLAFYFMRKQINPLNNIMKAAEVFGKGNNNFKLIPKGSYELRLLAKVFIKMRERIKNQISQRTLMLAGIGHDLRTPLTRMKLQIALLKDKAATNSLSTDVEEMKDMIDSYLTFAKGEGEENKKVINVFSFLKKEIKKNNTGNQVNISLDSLDKIIISARPLAFKRALNNILSNALSFAKKNIIISVKALKGEGVIILFEDDGPGIPANKRSHVIKAFYRMDESRLSKSASTGLGLTITRNIVNDHGGSLKLEDSTLGGLKVSLFFPN